MKANGIVWHQNIVEMLTWDNLERGAHNIAFKHSVSLRHGNVSTVITSIRIAAWVLFGYLCFM